MGPPGPFWRVARSAGDDREHPLAPGTLHEDIEPLLRGGVDPVHVLEDEEQTRLHGETLDETLKRGQCQLPPTLLRHRDWRVAIADRDRDDRGENGTVDSTG